jgi:hypothetical protein
MVGKFKNGSYRNRVDSCGLDSSGSGQGQVVDYFKHGNENSGLIKGREFLD